MLITARYPRLRANWKGYMNLLRIGYVPMYHPLGMGEPWVTKYRVCRDLPFFVNHFLAEG